MKENDDGWVYVPPMEDTFTVILGKSQAGVSDSVTVIGKNLRR
jgi:hypothetical protein